MTTETGQLTITVIALDAAPHAVERAVELARSRLPRRASSTIAAGAHAADLLITDLTPQEATGVMVRVGDYARVRGPAPHGTAWAIPTSIPASPTWHLRDGAIATATRPASHRPGGRGDPSPGAALVVVHADTCDHAGTLAARWLGRTGAELAELARAHNVAVRAQLTDGSTASFSSHPGPARRPAVAAGT
ncbi:hypothetical protein ACFY3U_04675 [Micromonospora sp. NPDC000089]|uniref:hypothetical protein n=1 Tax=unclassified Micromonospora TaxID=2617518 RepID=UPI0036B43972